MEKYELKYEQLQCWGKRDLVDQVITLQGDMIDRLKHTGKTIMMLEVANQDLTSEACYLASELNEARHEVYNSKEKMLEADETMGFYKDRYHKILGDAGQKDEIRDDLEKRLRMASQVIEAKGSIIESLEEWILG